MKLSEFTKAIAETCDLRPKAVAAVQEETFRQIRAAAEKGERVLVPGFGTFVGKGEETEGGSRAIRFRPTPAAETGSDTSDRPRRKKQNPNASTDRSPSDKSEPAERTDAVGGAIGNDRSPAKAGLN